MREIAYAKELIRIILIGMPQVIFATGRKFNAITNGGFIVPNRPAQPPPRWPVFPFTNYEFHKRIIYF